MAIESLPLITRVISAQSPKGATAYRATLRMLRLTGVGATFFTVSALALAPYHAAEQPIRDEGGRLSVIIDFSIDAHERYPAGVKAQTPPGQAAAFHHLPQVLNLVADYERRYGFSRTAMTSWVGNSVTAFLDRNQIERIRSDPWVDLVTENAYGTFSSPPPSPLPWSDLALGGETRSWGTQAVNGKPSASSNRRVYVVDSGVAVHQDLPSVIARKNIACDTTSAANSAAGICDTYAVTTGLNAPITYPVVGCYAHATHVAGIIGASSSGSTGTVGVYPGVQIVSVGTVEAQGSYSYGSGSPVAGSGTGWCANKSATISAVGAALDFVYQDTLSNASGLVTITNISMNAFRLGWTANQQPETNYSKIRRLATPAIAKDGRRYQG